MPSKTIRETIVRAVIVQDGCVLVNSTASPRTGQAYCALPGGHAEIYESCTEALRREFKEELAAEVTVHDLFFVSESIYEGRRRDDGARHELVLYFRAELALPLGQEDGRIKSPEFAKNFIWLPLEEMESSNLLPATIRGLLHEKVTASETASETANQLRYGFENTVHGRVS